VAMALADGHLLEKKAREQDEAAAIWHRKAKLAVSREDDVLARAALERALNHENLLASYRAQLAEQRAESQARRATYIRLEAKLSETKAQCEILVAGHRREKIVSNAAEARLAAQNVSPAALLDAALSRVAGRVSSEVQATAEAAIQAEASLKAHFAPLEQEDRVEQLLQELKRGNGRILATG